MSDISEGMILRAYEGKESIEYGLILALVVLVSVGALSFMGASFNDMLQAQDITEKGKPLFALLDPVPGESPETAGTPGTYPAYLPDSGTTATSGPNGMAPSGGEFAIPSGEGGIGSLTTSANGVELLADILDNIAAEGGSEELATIFGGNWDDIQAELRQMANTGHLIASDEQDVLRERYNVRGELNDVSQGITEYSKDYDDFVNRIRDNFGAYPPASAPQAVQDLVQLVEMSSGAITYSARAFVKEVDNSSDFYEVGFDDDNRHLDNVVGTEFQPGDLVTIPGTTATAAGSMEEGAAGTP